MVAPAFGGSTDSGCRVAMVNTGSGLRFTVALDRGGDIVDAFHNEHSLAYLSVNGLAKPSYAYNRDFDWLANWPAGLVTTCGPHAIGGPHAEDGLDSGLHGRYSNAPATLESIVNPDPHAGKKDMMLSMVVRDSRMFGPVFEIRRQIKCVLGLPQITICDEVTNRGDKRVAHNWLYHVNVGYPLLDEGAKFIYSGQAEYWQVPAPATPPGDAELNRLKRVVGGMAAHAGMGERGVIVQAPPDRKGLCHVGIVNSKLGLALELEYSPKCLPRVSNWQHYGPRGTYVSGIEPFNGSLLGKDTDTFADAEPHLRPGETKKYELTFKVHSTRQAIAAFAARDGQIRG